MLRWATAISIAWLMSCTSAAQDKYCGRAPFNKKGKYCCHKENAWNSKSEACANQGSYIKIHDNCGVSGRRRKQICCDKLNAWHGCPSPSPTPSPPSPTPPPTPAPSASFASSSTHYYPGDTHSTQAGQQGACGGADLDKVTSTLSGLTQTLGMHYFAVAIAQGMGQPLMCNADERVGKGVPSLVGNAYANVLHTYCGECIEFTTTDGTKVGGVVMDTCPTFGLDSNGNTLDNSKHCSKGGTANAQGFYNHIDIHGPSSAYVTDVVGNNPNGTIVAVTCPGAVTSALTSLAAASDSSSTSSLCSWYYDPHSGSWQGAPGMKDFGCSECSDSRRLNFLGLREVSV